MDTISYQAAMAAGEEMSDIWNPACERWIGSDYERACPEYCCDDQFGVLIGTAQIMDALLWWV